MEAELIIKVKLDGNATAQKRAAIEQLAAEVEKVTNYRLPNASIAVAYSYEAGKHTDDKRTRLKNDVRDGWSPR